MVNKGEAAHCQPSSSPTMERKKKVEWRTNLSSTEQQFPEDRSPMWDSETGHLLSYFLGGDNSNQGGNGMGNPCTQFATTGHSQQKPASSTLNNNGPMHNLFNNRSAINPMDYDDDPVPPPTPATQYYHHSSKPKAKPPAPQRPKSSDNPLMKMKVPFASEATSAVYRSDNPTHPMESISPTSMIGRVQEQLMLPPPPSDSKSDNSNNQSHLDWLQRLNAMATSSKMTTSQQAQQVYNMPPAPQQQVTGISFPITYHGTPAALHPAVPTSASFYPQLAHIKQQAGGAEESEGKRAKRLERNRESARKSRRRKKERLSHLEEKVAKLYSLIETERRKQINTMDDALAEQLKEYVARFPNDGNLSEEELKERLSNFIQITGPNCPVRRDVIEFQHSTLKRTIMPSYQKFLMWLTLHEEKYFVAGKELYGRQEGKQTPRVAPGKISSKQVGDELTNGRKLEDGTMDPPAKQSDTIGEQANQTAQAFDDARMWPLLCFELSVSVDQEERFMQSQKKIQCQDNIEEKRSQIAAATRMALNLKEAMMYQSHTAEMRSKRSFIDILTPKQTVLYQEWLASNRDRCKEVLAKRKETTGRISPNANESASLMEVCKKLEEVVISQEAK